MAEEKRLKYKFNIIAFLLIAIFCISNVSVTLENDTFYTIKVGEQIVNNGLTMQDTFSWHENLPYEYPHWAYDVIIYFIYNIGGFLGIYLSTIVFGIILGWCIYKVNLNITKNAITSLLVTIISIISIRNFITARAQLITYIMFIVTIYCIEKFLERKKKKYAIGLIIISIIIANIHVAVWPFFFVLFLPYIAEDIVYRIIHIFKLKSKRYSNIDKEKINELQTSIEKTEIKKDDELNNLYKITISKNDNIKYLILIMIICIFTGLLTPLKDTPYTYLYRTMKGNSTEYITEHLPTILIQEKRFLVLVLSYIGLLIFTKVKIKLSDLFMLGGLFLLSLIGRRHIALFVIINSIVLNRLICSIIEKHNKNFIMTMEKNVTNYIGATLIISMALIINCNQLEKISKQPIIDETAYPVKASEFILNNIDLKSAKLYNSYNYGSYLIFKNIPVFIDSRCDLYTPEINGGKDIFTDYINISSLKEDYIPKFEEYGITHVILKNSDQLKSVIRMDKNYKIIYEDKDFCLYEHI